MDFSIPASPFIGLFTSDKQKYFPSVASPSQMLSMGSSPDGYMGYISKTGQTIHLASQARNTLFMFCDAKVVSQLLQTFNQVLLLPFIFFN